MSGKHNKVFVGNLPDDCTSEALRDLFSPYGEVADLIMVKTYAFVTFKYDSDAKKAVSDLHKTKLRGKELTVQISTSHQSRYGVAKGGNDRRPPKEDQRRKSSGLALPPGFVPPVGPGGILGGGNGGILGGGTGGILGVAPQAGLGLLTAVQAVTSAVAASNMPGSDMPNQGDDRSYPDSHNLPTAREIEAPRKGLGDGYVIYERYYIDPNHPLLKGLPLPELPRVTDSFASQDSRRDTFSRKEDYNVSNYRERSPIQQRREFDYERDRSRNYSDNYFDRR